MSTPLPPEGSRPHRKTGPKPTFDREDVVNQALAVGLDNFTMSEVAKGLGVATSALYRIYSRDTLLTACVEHIAAATPLFLGGDWKDLLRDYAHHLSRMCATYPGLAQALLAHPNNLFAFQTNVTNLVEKLGDAGFSRAQSIFAIDVISNFVFSSGPFRHSFELFAMTDSLPADREDDEEIAERILDQKIDFVLRSLETDRPSY